MSVQYWDATKISALKRCPAYLQYNCLDRWQPKGGNVDLAFGAAFADALTTYYREDIRAAVRVCMEASIPTGSNNKNRVTLVRSLVWYVEEYKDQEVYKLASGEKAVELSFEIDVADDIVFCGHLDLVTVVNKDLYVNDQKTTTMTLSNYFYSMYELTDQFAMYSFVAKELLGSPIRGVIIDGVQVAVGFTAFGRKPTTFSKKWLDEWLRDTLWHIRNYDGTPRLNISSCNLYSSVSKGKFGCEFKSICKTDPSMREVYLKEGFNKIEPWRPEVKR